MKVPFIDLGLQNKEILNEIQNSMNDVIFKSDFIMGKKVVEFEKKISAYLNTSSFSISFETQARF